jgi:hypothetical protein
MQAIKFKARLLTDDEMKEKHQAIHEKYATTTGTRRQSDLAPKGALILWHVPIVRDRMNYMKVTSSSDAVRIPMIALIEFAGKIAGKSAGNFEIAGWMLFRMFD